MGNVVNINDEKSSLLREQCRKANKIAATVVTVLVIAITFPVTYHILLSNVIVDAGNVEYRLLTEDSEPINQLINQAYSTGQMSDILMVNHDDIELMVFAEYLPNGTYEDTIKFAIDTCDNQVDVTNNVYKVGSSYTCLTKSYEDGNISDSVLYMLADKGVITVTASYDGDGSFEYVKSYIESIVEPSVKYLEDNNVLVEIPN